MWIILYHLRKIGIKLLGNLGHTIALSTYMCNVFVMVYMGTKSGSDGELVVVVDGFYSLAITKAKASKGIRAQYPTITKEI